MQLALDIVNFAILGLMAITAVGMLLAFVIFVFGRAD